MAEVPTGDPVNELKTLRDFIRWSASRFAAAGLVYGHGTDNALDEAVALVLGLLNLDHDLPPLYLDAALTLPERQTLAGAIERRISERVPVPYLTHQAWFAGLSFYVDERVLIPRSPLAEMIEQGFAPWLAAREPARILDLCTGSGCIAIACAYAFPQAHIDAVDISSDVLAVTRINIQRHAVSHSVQPLESDLFDGLAATRYDLIVSNPPYVDAGDMAALPDEFRHEPNDALAAGSRGLDIVDRIMKYAGRYLAPDGILVVEVGNSEQAVVETYPDVPFVWPEFERGGHGVFVLSADQLA